MAPKKKEAAAPVYDGPMDGQGKFFYGNGATYEGCWKVVLPEDAVAPADGSPFIPAKVRHGMGTYTDGGCVYEGEFAEDVMHGQGTFKYASGSSYSGEWHENKYHGQGQYAWPDGRVYDGTFVENVMHGKGEIRDTAGRVWSGQFHQGSGAGLTFDLP